jgi:hypothetical protein
MTTRARSRFSLKTYGAGVEQFRAGLEEALYHNLAGLDETMELAGIYRRHSRLFTSATIDALRERAEGSDARAAEARSYLAFAIGEHLAAAVAELTEKVETAESRAVVIWRGERIPYRGVRNRAADIGSRAERNALAESYHEAVEAINPVREERFEAITGAAQALGYRDLVDLVNSTAGFDLDQLGSEMRAFLADSETVYFAALRRYLAEIDIEQGDASQIDLEHVLRGAGWDPWFGRPGMLRALRGTLSGMGIELDGQHNIMLDVEPRPLKSPRAFCVTINVPDDIRLVMQPRGGWDDYAALLHEAAHAEHFAHVAATLPVAYRLLGDNSVTEGYAALLERLSGDPVWTIDQVGMSADEAPAYADFAAFWYLGLLRRGAAQLLFELNLQRERDLALAREQFAGLLGLTLGVRIAPEEYLAHVDDGFGIARYVRAAMLEGSLSAELRRRHGEAWWREPQAGRELRDLWSRGQELNADALVAQLGYDHLDWRPVLRQIRTRLIGEMSGYGGPNITTRAGTRKV